MATKNGRGAKIAGGISLSVVACAFGLFYMISDRAVESGEAKATVKAQVEAVSERVDHLETHASDTEKILNGKDGIVATVEVIKSKIDNIEKQGTYLREQSKLILQKLDDLKK